MPSESLYGSRLPSKSAPKTLPASTALSFSTHLSSLISASRPTKSSSSDPPRLRTKPDIFTTRQPATSKPSKKRPLDSDQPSAQSHQTNADIGNPDSDTLRLSKRRLADKARLYASLKRGETVNPSDAARNGGLVDFDRKWAETKDTVEEDEAMSSGMSSSEEDSEGKKVEYTDSLGRTRLLSPRSHRRMVREEQTARTYGELSAADVARPAEPERVIYGDTVQHQAFNPDASTARKMEDLAAKRDREATPPEEKHYDASEEIRGRGTGFYAFSRDQEIRRDEMQALERERERTERVRREKGLDGVKEEKTEATTIKEESKRDNGDIKEEKPDLTTIKNERWMRNEPAPGLLPWNDEEQHYPYPVPDRRTDPSGYAAFRQRRQRDWLVQKQMEHERRLEQESLEPGGRERQEQRALLQRPGQQASGAAVSEGEQRDGEKEARRKLIEEQRGRVRAERFLKGLEGDLLGGEEEKDEERV